MFEAADAVLRYEVVRVLAWEHQHHHDQLSPLLARYLDRVSAAEAEAEADAGPGAPGIEEAQQALARAREAHDRFWATSGLDALVTPSAPGEAPGLATTGDSVFNRVWTSLGVPAVQVPAGLGPGGLPVGIQLTGRSWADRDLVAVAAQVEQALAG